MVLDKETAWLGNFFNCNFFDWWHNDADSSLFGDG